MRRLKLIRTIASRIVIVCASVALSLLLLEVFLRIAGATDADGRYHFLHYTLESPDLPLNELRLHIDGYLANQDIATVIYDANTGWAFRPNSTRQAGTFTINSAGFRSMRDFARSPLADTLRIALFGDSFTAGDDVSDEETWAHQLEVTLNAGGLRAEVLNFGVGAYGMGQAYLRWRHLGSQFAPDIVIFGLQPENLQRNVNIFRQLLHGSGPAFSKPRFVLIDGELQLLNSPTLPPEQLLEVFANFNDHPLAPYEYHYQSRFQANRWWASSRLFSLIFAALQSEADQPGLYAAGSEGGELGKAIIDAFAEDVTQAGAHFAIAHLPLQWHLREHYLATPPGQPPFQHVLDHSRSRYAYIGLEAHIDAAYLDDAFWTASKHYGPRLHKLVAEVLAREISDCVMSRACPLGRFEDPALLRIQ